MKPLLKFGRTGPLLGMCVREASLLIAEISVAPGAAHPQPARVVEFQFPHNIALDEPQRLGKALAIFLKSHGITGGRAILGVPARWVISTHHHMPPADRATAQAALWLHGTETIAARVGPMVFDYAGEPAPEATTNLLLVGLQRVWMGRLLEMAEAAELELAAIMPTAAALAQVTALHTNHSLILHLNPDSAELTGHDRENLRPLRHLGSTAPQPLLAALRRAAVRSSEHSPPDLVLWDDNGIDRSFLEELRTSLGLEVIEAGADWVLESSHGSHGLSALALTVAHRTGERPLVDFLHPRLSAPAQKRPRRRLWIAAAAAAILAIICAWADRVHLDSQIAQSNQELDQMQPAMVTAAPFVAGMEYAATFHADKPRFLSSLRDLTAALGDDGQTTFTGFNMQSDMKCEVTGKSAAEQNILDFVDKLNASGLFADVNCKLEAPRDHNNQKELSFMVTFTYLAKT